MSCALALEMWDGYGPKQRRFDIIHWEWDVCTEFDLNEVSDFNCWDEEDSNNLDEDFTSQPTITDEPIATHEPIVKDTVSKCPLVVPSSINSSNWEKDIQETLAKEAELVSVDCVSTLDILQQQYGFVPAADCNPLDLSWNQCKVLIGGFDLADKYAAAMQTFVHCFSAYKPVDNVELEWKLSSGISPSQTAVPYLDALLPHQSQWFEQPLTRIWPLKWSHKHWMFLGSCTSMMPIPPCKSFEYYGGHH